MSEDAVLWKVDDRGVVDLRLNRPARNNAYDGALIDGLHRALDAVDAGAVPRAVVIRGNGRHFQAGADLTWLDAVRGDTSEANIAASEATARAVDRLNHLPCVTIAAVQGACVGGGTGLLSACDVVIATDTAVFAISEVRWGLTAAIIVPQLVDTIGVRQVRRYALTGERFDARTAERIGLVHEVVSDDRLDATVDGVITSVLANAPEAVRDTKAQAMAYAHGQLTDGELSGLIAAHAAKRQSVEAGEGIASFKEKRPASWQPAEAS